MSRLQTSGERSVSSGVAPRDAGGRFATGASERARRRRVVRPEVHALVRLAQVFIELIQLSSHFGFSFHDGVRGQRRERRARIALVDDPAPDVQWARAFGGVRRVFFDQPADHFRVDKSLLRQRRHGFDVGRLWVLLSRR